MNPMTGADSSQTTNLDLNMSTPRTPPVSGMSPAVGRLPKMSFHVEYDLGRGDGAQPIRMTIPKDESYNKFLGRLRNIFYGDSFEKSLRRWEYTLVSRYEKADPLPLTSPNTYYAMVSELLSTRSRWRHALIRRSHSENPILKAVAEGKFHLTPASQLLNAAATDTSLPGNLLTRVASKPDISIINTLPVADAVHQDASNADTPMPDAPTDEATPAVLTSTPSSKAWVIKPASATSLSRTHSPGPLFDKHTSHPSTPSSTPITRARSSSQFSSPLAPALRSRTLKQSYTPLISSPLKPSTNEGDRRSLLSSPTAPVTIAPKPRRRSSPLPFVANSQSSIPLESSPLATDNNTKSPRIKFTSPLTPSAIAQRPAISPSSTRSPTTNVKDFSKQLDSMSATAAIEQDPVKEKGSFELPVTDAPNLSTKISTTSAPSASTTSALHPSSPSMHKEHLHLQIQPLSSSSNSNMRLSDNRSFQQPRHPSYWKPEDDELLMRVRAQDLTFAQIALQYFPGKSTQACQIRYAALYNQERQTAPPAIEHTTPLLTFSPLPPSSSHVTSPSELQYPPTDLSSSQTSLALHSNHSSLPIASSSSAQAPSAVLPFVPVPSTLEVSGSIGDLEEGNSPLASALEAASPPATSSIAAAPAPELFQRLLNLPPRPTSTSIPREAPPAKPTPILPPRRPLRIISKQRLNHKTQYHVHWNNGRNSWEAHDSLHRDYPAFVDRYLREQR